MLDNSVGNKAAFLQHSCFTRVNFDSQTLNITQNLAGYDSGKTGGNWA